jgi:hypothetical protein
MVCRADMDGLSTAERTGSHVFYTIWSYMTDTPGLKDYVALVFVLESVQKTSLYGCKHLGKMIVVRNTLKLEIHIKLDISWRYGYS